MFSFSKKPDPQIPAVSRLKRSGAQTKITEITNPYVQLQNKHRALTSLDTGQKWFLFLLKNHFLNQHLYVLSNCALLLQKFTSTFSFHKVFSSLVGSFTSRTAVWNNDSTAVTHFIQKKEIQGAIIPFEQRPNLFRNKCSLLALMIKKHTKMKHKYIFFLLKHKCNFTLPIQDLPCRNLYWVSSHTCNWQCAASSVFSPLNKAAFWVLVTCPWGGTDKSFLSAFLVVLPMGWS